MSAMSINKAIPPMNLMRSLLVAAAMPLLASAAHAAAPGITGATFNLTAQPAYLNQPDGQAVYSWGYGCASTTGISYLPKLPTATASCGLMQVPGPTLIVTAPASGTTTITINLTNNLPAAAGNTSMLFPGFNVSATNGVAGLLTQEAPPGATVTYTLTIPSTAAGTHAYYSGTQG